MSCGIVLFNQASMKIKQVTLLLTMFILYQGALVNGYTFSLCTHRGPPVKNHVVKSAAGIAGVTLPRAINPPPSCTLLAFAPDEKQTILHYFFTVNRSPDIRGYKKSFGANI